MFLGTRDHVAKTDLSDILPEDIEEKVKEAAEISMGTEISDDDIIKIQHLCEQVKKMNMCQFYNNLGVRNSIFIILRGIVTNNYVTYFNLLSQLHFKIPSHKEKGIRIT